MLILTNRVPAIRRYEELSYAIRVSTVGVTEPLFFFSITYHLFQTSDGVKSSASKYKDYNMNSSS